MKNTKLKSPVYYPATQDSRASIDVDVTRGGVRVTTCVIDVETFLQGRKSFPCGNGYDYTLSDDEQKEMLSFYKEEEQKHQNKMQEREEEER